jgi:hypothetical protein
MFILEPSFAMSAAPGRIFHAVRVLGLRPCSRLVGYVYIMAYTYCILMLLQTYSLVLFLTISPTKRRNKTAL